MTSSYRKLEEHYCSSVAATFLSYLGVTINLYTDVAIKIVLIWDRDHRDIKYLISRRFQHYAISFICHSISVGEKATQSMFVSAIM